ncbi:MAG: hypothetical protein U0231_15560 [Nitrospiraceae bacterium]
MWIRRGQRREHSAAIGHYERKLKGLLDARDTTIPSLQSTLNTLAAQLVSQVNTQHQAGYGLRVHDAAFFTTTGTSAATISVAVTDRLKIAASSTAAGTPGTM